MKLGVRSKLFLASLTLVLVCVLGVAFYVRVELGQLLSEGVTAQLAVRAQLVAAQVEESALPLERGGGWQARLQALGKRGSGRVTLIRADGVVLADSQLEPTALDNHASRPEIAGALDGNASESTRRSRSYGSSMRYYAVPVRRAGAVVAAVRVALPAADVSDVEGRLTRVLVVATLMGVGAAIALSLVASWLATRSVRALTHTARRMAQGDLETRARPMSADEYGELGRSLDQLARSLSSTLAQLRAERDRFAGVLAGMQEGVLMLDESGRVALVNPALREMLLIGADAVGKTPLEVIRHAELKELLDEARIGGESVSGEIELSGLKPRQLLVRVSRVSADPGGVFAVFVDVTEMRRLETMRRDFVANVSHELRTPVTAIRSAAETLELSETQDAATTRMFIGIIDRNAARLHGLVEDLLDLSRIESREFRIQLEELELEPIFEQVVSLFEDRAQKKRIEIAINVPPDIGLARTDRRAIEHVLTNLVDNAVKYCPNGSRIALDAKDGIEFVEVRVSDTGPGIDVRHLPRLFERFYRVDTGRSRELGGTGLGLSIVKHLIEAMGGTVSVASELGKGTTFTFTLRRADSPASIPFG